jgi:hypothetical protein
VVDIYRFKFSKPENIEKILLHHDIEEYDFKQTSEELFRKFLNIDLDEFIFDFIEKELIKKLDTEEFGTCIKTLINIYLEF